MSSGVMAVSSEKARATARRKAIAMDSEKMIDVNDEMAMASTVLSLRPLRHVSFSARNAQVR